MIHCRGAWLLAWLSLILAPSTLSQAVPPPPKLAGIARLGGREWAVLEYTRVIRPGVWRPETGLLGAGQRQDDLMVISINLTNSVVELNYQGSNCVFHVDSVGLDPRAPYVVNFTNAPLRGLIDLYAKATDRTILEHPLLSAGRFTFTESVDDPAAIAQCFARAFTNAGVVSIPEGEKLLLLIPAYAAASALSQMQKLAPLNLEMISDQQLPVGAVTLIGIPASQTAVIYSSLARRELDRDSVNPIARDLLSVSLKNQTPLTTREIIHAFDIQFAWRGVRMLPVGERTLKMDLLEHE